MAPPGRPQQLDAQIILNIIPEIAIDQAPNRLYTVGLITAQNENNYNMNGVCYDHSMSDVRRSRPQDHNCINSVFLRAISGRTHMRPVRPPGAASPVSIIGGKWYIQLMMWIQ